MVSNSKRTATWLICSVLMFLVIFDGLVTFTEASRVRGEQAEDTNARGARRILFADKWVSPDGQQRGGAGAQAKGLVELEGMMTRPPSVAPSQPPTPPGRNDQCSNALGPIDVSPVSAGSAGLILYDDTTGGAMIPMVLPDRCDRISNSSPGVWYQVVGTGSTMTASLCNSGTTFDSKITVYSGDCNGVLTCVGANDDAVSPFCSINRQASRVQWSSESGVTYYLLIHGFGNRVGAFQLSVQTQFLPGTTD